ncbi:hypothetical protein [Paraburkholderia humisilvae]|uniref:Uncharacterized protein n=1 Tax=Paraburkholderia humisilvae TaxID=627669 RepID=A0A6J5DJM8_9BURK|nr:hypothetical protein [Paraburkholderia humisilvae]CAB3754153.1 hypothetical protein LMG29542_02265 [Paraburkholderia humisilvae]
MSNDSLRNTEKPEGHHDAVTRPRGWRETMAELLEVAEARNSQGGGLRANPEGQRRIDAARSLLASAPQYDGSQPVKRPVSLVGMREAILTPLRDERDEDGMMGHPALPDLDEDVGIVEFLMAFGIQAAFVMMERDAPETYQRWTACNSANCSDWEPGRPEGEDWLLIAIYDSNDGPCALYVRDLKREHSPRRRRVPMVQPEGDAVRKAWDAVKVQIGTDGWTTGDEINYRGFFNWGWQLYAQSLPAAMRDVLGGATKQTYEFDVGELAAAGAAYALHASDKLRPFSQGDGGYDKEAPPMWPWAEHDWQPGKVRDDLVKSARMIVAEIVRHDIASGSTPHTQPHPLKQHAEDRGGRPICVATRGGEAPD